MGFETFWNRDWWYVWTSFELCPYGIWNCQLKIISLKLTMFELCPYGIWNYSNGIAGITSAFVWTLSLWDLKLCLFTQVIYVVSVWTLSLWDLKRSYCFFINIIKWFELCPYGIWNSSITLNLLRHEEVWTLSLWDLKPISFCVKIKLIWVWTLSLWDLKHIRIKHLTTL